VVIVAATIALTSTRGSAHEGRAYAYRCGATCKLLTGNRNSSLDTPRLQGCAPRSPDRSPRCELFGALVSCAPQIAWQQSQCRG